MSRILLICVIAVMFVQQKASDNSVRNQSQQNAAHKQAKSNGAPSGQPAANPSDQKAARDADKSQNQKVDVVSVPKVSIKPEKDALDVAILICTVVLTVIGIVGTAVAVKTLIHIKRQADTLEEHKTKFDDLAKAANSNAEASILQVRAMQEQITEMSVQSGLMASTVTHSQELAKQAVKQSDLTQRQLDLANRPWVCLDSITATSDLVFKDSGEAFIFVSYQLRNVGHSVAQHVQPWVEPIIVGIDDPREVEERISAQLKKPIDSAFDHGKLIFPSQVLVDTYPVMIRKEVLENAIKNSPFKEGENRLPCFGLELFVCFDYQSTLDTVHHQTQAMYALGYANDKGMIMGAFYPNQRNYPAARLTATYKGYGAYAD